MPLAVTVHGIYAQWIMGASAQLSACVGSGVGQALYLARVVGEADAVSSRFPGGEDVGYLVADEGAFGWSRVVGCDGLVDEVRTGLTTIRMRSQICHVYITLTANLNSSHERTGRSRQRTSQQIHGELPILHPGL